MMNNGSENKCIFTMKSIKITMLRVKSSLNFNARF
jgi:hypothetical protein